MCVVNLNVSLQPCAHRWYTLLRPCNTSTNLSNCPEKVRLEGWERRTEACPWCGPASPSSDVNLATHRLFGTSDSFQSRRRSDSTVASAESLLARGRRNSISAFSPITSRSSSRDSDLAPRKDLDRAEKNQGINRRLDEYIATAIPDTVSNKRASMRLPKPAMLESLMPDNITSRRASIQLPRASIQLPRPTLLKKDSGDALSFLGVSSGMLSRLGGIKSRKKKARG